MGMNLTPDQSADYEQRCRKNRAAWEADRAGRSMLSSPFVLVGDGAGETASEGDGAMGKNEGSRRSADRLADLARRHVEGWVPERRAKGRRRSADRLTDRFNGKPEEGPEDGGTSAA